MKGPSVSEVRDNLDALEKYIASVLRKFEEVNGVSIVDLDILHQEAAGQRKEVWKVNIDVCI